MTQILTTNEQQEIFYLVDLKYMGNPKYYSSAYVHKELTKRRISRILNELDHIEDNIYYTRRKNV